MPFYEPRGGFVACDECGCVVESSERGRSLHAAWHAGREELVVDLREVKEKVA